MRASMSSIVFLILCFNCGGMILRTGLLHRFESASGVRWGAGRRLAGMLRQTQGAQTHLGDSPLFYPSGDHKPMVLQRFYWTGLMLWPAVPTKPNPLAPPPS